MCGQWSFLSDVAPGRVVRVVCRRAREIFLERADDETPPAVSARTRGVRFSYGNDLDEEFSRCLLQHAFGLTLRSSPLRLNMAWSPPTTAEQRSAISIRTAPKDLQTWLQPQLFPPIPEPDDESWGRGRGQSFDKYVASNPKRPVGGRVMRNRIYLQPLGEAEAARQFPDLATLAEGVTAFYGMECIVLPMKTLRQLETHGKVKIRTRGKKCPQINASDINNNLKAIGLPADGFTMCAVTMHDIWKGDFNYLFGLAFLAAHVGIFSFYRHQPNVPECEYHHGKLERQPGDAATILRRGFQTLSHELGHTFGLKHCIYFSCLMQGANSLEEAEGRMPDLCPVCLRKLLWCVNAQTSPAVRARYMSGFSASLSTIPRASASILLGWSRASMAQTAARSGASRVPTTKTRKRWRRRHRRRPSKAKLRLRGRSRRSRLRAHLR